MDVGSIGRFGPGLFLAKAVWFMTLSCDAALHNEQAAKMAHNLVAAHLEAEVLLMVTM